MLNGNVFVFDNVVHMYDLSDDNLKRPDSGFDRQWHLKIGYVRRSEGQDESYGITDGYGAFAKKWTAKDLGKMLFEESSTDMAMSQGVPLYDVYKDGFAPVRAQYEFHKAFPEPLVVLRRRRSELPQRRRGLRRDGTPGEGVGRRLLQVLQRPSRRQIVALRRSQDRLSDV